MPTNTRSDLAFRLATDQDWPDIHRIFDSVTATSDTYPYPPSLTETEARSIWMNPSHTTYVAAFGDDVVGTAYIKANMLGLGDHVANAGWMVDPSRHGEGIGRPFAEYIIDQARKQEYRAMQFNAVVATNGSAIKLWESLGFEIVGTVPDAFRHSTNGLTAIHIMYRKL